MSLIHNERVKLLATYLNGLAIAVAAVGLGARLFGAVRRDIQPRIDLSCLDGSDLPCRVGSLTFRGELGSQESAPMTTTQFLLMMIMPAGTLVIAGLALLWVRTWDDGKPKPGE